MGPPMNAWCQCHSSTAGPLLMEHLQELICALGKGSLKLSYRTLYINVGLEQPSEAAQIAGSNTPKLHRTCFFFLFFFFMLLWLLPSHHFLFLAVILLHIFLNRPLMLSMSLWSLVGLWLEQKANPLVKEDRVVVKMSLDLLLLRQNPQHHYKASPQILPPWNIIVPSVLLRWKWEQQ